MWNSYINTLLKSKNVMRCAIWYHLYNLKNVKNTHGGVLLLVKLQANGTKSRKASIHISAYWFVKC